MSHPELPWNFELFNYNSNLTMDTILSHPKLPWNWLALSSNRNITFDMVLKGTSSLLNGYAHLSDPNKNWNWDYLSSNQNLTMAMVLNGTSSLLNGYAHLSHPDKPWNFNAISRNYMEKGKEKYIKDKVHQFKFIDEFKILSAKNNLMPNVIENIIIEYLSNITGFIYYKI